MLNLSPYKIDTDIQEEKLNTLKALKTPDAGKIFARWLLIIFGVFFVMLFLPWQQNVRGGGKVTAFSPQNRPQTVETAIPGRIIRWRVSEGEFVNRGDTLLQLSEIKDKFFDPEILDRLAEQIAAKEGSIESKTAKAEALRFRIAALKDARDIKIQQVKNKYLQAQLKLQSDSIDYEAEKIRFKNFENQFDRNKTLYEAGNIALTKFQDIEIKLQESRMKRISTENKFLEARADVVNARVDIAGTAAEYADKINKADSELNETLASLFEAQGSLAKMRNEYMNVKVRQDQYHVIAPQTGYVVRAIKSGIGETLKEGEAVATVMPYNPDIAVELYIRAMDVPLISKGRHVRIEFDGWPALQFSGWPSVAVGTFGGTVQVVDYVNSKNGEFRVLVTPDPLDEPWPKQLRQGSGIKGWVMLDNVPVWYEIWRQLNGFPPSLYDGPLEGEPQVAEKDK
jgi:multidrug resistance efflux pump